MVYTCTHLLTLAHTNTSANAMPLCDPKRNSSPVCTLLLASGLERKKIYRPLGNYMRSKQKKQNSEKMLKCSTRKIGIFPLNL